MKGLNLTSNLNLKKTLQLFVQLVLLAVLAAGATACSGKKGKSAIRAGQRTYPPTGSPTAPGSQPQNPNSQWGEITNFNRAALAEFLRFDGFGDVSPYSNQPTGIRFFGQINNQGYGQVYMFVFDSYSLQGQGPIELPVFNCRGYSQNYNLVLECTDNTGDLTLVGQELPNGEFSGQVYFDGNKTLGQFRINACGFLGCY